MPPRRPMDERDQLIVKEFEYVKEQLVDLKNSMSGVGEEIAALRNNEIVTIRESLAKQDNRITLLEYRGNSSKAWVSYVAPAVISVLVAAIAAGAVMLIRGGK